MNKNTKLLFNIKTKFVLIAILFLIASILVLMRSQFSIAQDVEANILDDTSKEQISLTNNEEFASLYNNGLDYIITKDNGSPATPEVDYKYYYDDFYGVWWVEILENNLVISGNGTTASTFIKLVESEKISHLTLDNVKAISDDSEACGLFSYVANEEVASSHDFTLDIVGDCTFINKNSFIKYAYAFNISSYKCQNFYINGNDSKLNMSSTGRTLNFENNGSDISNLVFSGSLSADVSLYFISEAFAVNLIRVKNANMLLTDNTYLKSDNTECTCLAIDTYGSFEVLDNSSVDFCGFTDGSSGYSIINAVNDIIIDTNGHCYFKAYEIGGAYPVMTIDSQDVSSELLIKKVKDFKVINLGDDSDWHMLNGIFITAPSHIIKFMDDNAYLTGSQGAFSISEVENQEQVNNCYLLGPCIKLYGSSELNADLKDVNMPVSVDYSDYYAAGIPFVETENGEKVFAKTVVASFDHNLETIDRKEPTYNNNGHLSFYHCTECDKYFEDENAEVEILDLKSWLALGGKGCLPALKYEFEEFIKHQLQVCDALLLDSDSDATRTLIEQAKHNIINYKYDDNKTMEENKQAVFDIVNKLITDVEAQRALENAGVTPKTGDMNVISILSLIVLLSCFAIFYRRLTN